MIKKLTLTIFLMTFAMLAQANAQTVVPTEKQAALKELGMLLLDESTTIDFLGMVVVGLERHDRETIDTLLKERADLTTAERLALEEMLLKDAEVMVGRLPERLSEKFDYKKWIGENIASAYDKHYTLDEIRELIAFYKTPTGQKTLKLAKTIESETYGFVLKNFSLKAGELNLIFKEQDRKELEQKLNAKKPRTKK